MKKQELVKQIRSKKSFLIVGLDSDYEKIPSHLMSLEDPVFEFNKQIIDTTHEFCVGYKLNTAFYESKGVKGLLSLQKTLDYIPKGLFTIADAKRGDIGNTSTQYAKAFFDKSASGMECDSVTVAPYMGEDSVKPFLAFKDKWVILLALTSNKGSLDFQFHKGSNEVLWEKVVTTAMNWGNDENLMFVVGATRGEDIKKVRDLAPNHFFLVPGVGAQGGSLEEVVKYGWNKDCGLLINSSRGIIFADSTEKFAVRAGEEAKKLQEQMAKFF
jgi:orotidine-5'-phosphate decarboxylase